MKYVFMIKFFEDEVMLEGQGTTDHRPRQAVFSICDYGHQYRDDYTSQQAFTVVRGPSSVVLSTQWGDGMENQ